VYVAPARCITNLMRRYSRVCICVLACWASWAQALSHSSDIAKEALTITVKEGDGAINSIRLHRGHDPVLEVRDSAGTPVSGATVVFVLPATGPSGSFLDGSLSLTTRTDDGGVAVGRGLRPNSVAGQFRIRATASWRGTVGAATLVQTNAEPVIRSGRSKKIAIIAIILGAAGGGAAFAARGGNSNAATSAAVPSAPGGSISPGAPSVGPPH